MVIVNFEIGNKEFEVRSIRESGYPPTNNERGSIWKASFVSYVDEYGAIPMGMSIDEDLVNLIILPYNKETAKLIGTTDNWEGNNN